MSSLSFLIDTDWVIDHFNNVAEVTQRLRELASHGLALSIISAAELWEGVYFSRDQQRSQVMLELFVSGVTVLNLDEQICKKFGEFRGSLRRRGQSMGDFDLLIAATALRYDLTLLTNNRKHFANIAGLRIESR